jgi:hypothetical protein
LTARPPKQASRRSDLVFDSHVRHRSISDAHLSGGADDRVVALIGRDDAGA